VAGVGGEGERDTEEAKKKQAGLRKEGKERTEVRLVNHRELD
jgi:hypothetical protein